MKLRQAASVVGMGALALALSGCMKLDMDLELNNDDTVDGTMIVAFSKSLSDLMGDSMVDEMLNESGADLPEGATTEPYEDDEYQGVEYTFTDAPLDEFSDSEMSITHEDGQWEFTGTMDASQDALTGGEDLGGMGDMSSMMEGMEVSISITFPGEVLETNGTVDGTTVTWSPEFGEVVEMHATASETGGGGGLPVWLWILIGVVVLAALLGGLFYFSRSRSGPATPSEGTESEAASVPGGAYGVGGEGSADVPPPPGTTNATGDTTPMPQTPPAPHTPEGTQAPGTAGSSDPRESPEDQQPR